MLFPEADGDRGGCVALEVDVAVGGDDDAGGVYAVEGHEAAYGATAFEGEVVGPGVVGASDVDAELDDALGMVVQEFGELFELDLRHGEELGGGVLEINGLERHGALL